MLDIEIISSKSDAHRALICAALSDTPCEVVVNATSKDIEATKACMAALAAGDPKMYCGESGSTLRFLLPVMSALGKRVEFYPEGRLPQRPLSPLYEELVAHGVKLSQVGEVPFISEGQLRSGTFTIDGGVSSQYISGLLFALPMLEGDSEICITGKLESAAYVEMTLDTISRFGVVIEKTENGFFVKGNQKYHGPEKYYVEGDWSNGCFMLAAGAIVEGGMRVKGLKESSIQGDKKIISLLQEMGARVKIESEEVCVEPSELKGIDIDASQIPDMVPILACLACKASGTTKIYNAGRLRIKESDRLAAVSDVLNTLGGKVTELEDGLIIEGTGTLKGGCISSYNDHRIVMMAAVCSLFSEGIITIEGSNAVNKSYPGFFDDFKKLGLDSKIERK